MCIKNFSISKKLHVNIPVPKRERENHIPFNFVSFGISQFASDGLKKNFLVYAWYVFNSIFGI